jgi:hypothetical protein
MITTTNIPMTRFSALPIGARFEFRGRRYEKLARSFAGDEDRCGNVFQGETEVVWLGGSARPEPARPSRNTVRRPARRFVPGTGYGAGAAPALQFAAAGR